jgi:hypothetical protein
MSAPSTDVLNQVREALDEARQAGRPAPGRPTLVRLTGATDHAVRMALAAVAEEPGGSGGELSTEVVSSGGLGASLVFNGASPGQTELAAGLSPATGMGPPECSFAMSMGPP